MLSMAISIAIEGHEGQCDKAGMPYVLHLLRVKKSVDTEKEMICAVLHDILEDTNITPEDLLEKGFDVEIVNAIKSVTRDENEKDYFDFIRRAKENPIGRKVKIADLKDNMNIGRITNPSNNDYERMEKYKIALSILESE